jgi:hypothetical protein
MPRFEHRQCPPRDVHHAGPRGAKEASINQSRARAARLPLLLDFLEF